MLILLRNGIKELSKKGISSVEYIKNGVIRRETLEVAVRRATLTSVNQTVSKIQESRCEEMDCNLVETTAHSGSSLSHCEWQGKVFMLTRINILT